MKLILESLIINKELSLINYYKSVHGIWFLGDLAINTVIVSLVILFCKGSIKHDCKYFLLGIPIAVIPIVGYSVLGLFMYLFFVIGFLFKFYYKGEYYSLLEHWRKVLFIYIVCLGLYNNMPYEPSSFILSFKKYTLENIIVVDFLKTVLALSGSYLMLFSVYKILPFLRGTWLELRAIEQGKHTLDIYLIQIIILETIGGYLYHNYVKETGLNIFHSYGFLFEIISTFVCSCIMMEIIVFAGRLANKNYYIAKLLFYRDNREIVDCSKKIGRDGSKDQVN